jgi:crotonobetainyl-CoA:carnitine CoA-transferase CaiB-like acyl-CoA transferase
LFDLNPVFVGHEPTFTTLQVGHGHRATPSSPFPGHGIFSSHHGSVPGQATVKLTSDDRFDSPKVLPKAGTITVRNISAAIHFMLVSPVKDGTTDDVQKFFSTSTGSQDQPKFALDGPLIQMGVLSPGRQADRLTAPCRIARSPLLDEAMCLSFQGNLGRGHSDYLSVEGRATDAAVQPRARHRRSPANPVPERWVPERILRGHLAAASLPAHIARSGDDVVLTGPGIPGGPLVCRLDRQGPCAVRLDEPLAQAACGLMAVHGRGRGRRAARLGVDVVTTAAGVVLAQAAMAGMLVRLRGRPLPSITVSMAGTALLTVSQYLAAGTADEPDFPVRAGSGHPPPFRSADGVTFELEALHAQPWRQLWTSLGVPEPVAGRAWRPFMLRYATAVAPLPAALHAATEAHPFAALTCAAASAGVAVQRLRRHSERRDELGGSKPFAAPWTVAPMGPAASRSAPLCSGDDPLAGMVVVETGRATHAALAGHLLRLLGAEVIRIEPTGGDPLRDMSPMAGDCSARFLALNRGKRSLAADLWNPVGRRAVLDSAAHADVFVDGWAPGRAAQLGLDHDRLAAANPRLVHAHTCGWGDAPGEYPLLGTECMVQAYAALPDHLTPTGQAPAGSLMSVLDVLGGLVATSGVLAGLLGRERDGRGRRVRSSLLSAATLLQSQLGGVRGPDGRPEFGTFGVPLPASDGDLVISRTAFPQAVTAALELAELTQLPAAIAAQPVDRSLALLTPAGIDAVRVCHDLADLPGTLWAADLLHHDRCAVVHPPWAFTP